MKASTYLRRRFKKIDSSLEDFRQNQNMEALHAFRVEVKKLKAICLLLNDTFENFSMKHHFAIHKKLFRRAGSIRDLDTIGKLAREYKTNIPSSYADPSSCKKKIKKLKKQSRNYSGTLHKREKDLVKIAKYLKRKQIRHYVHELSRAISRLFQQRNADSNLHVIRKMAKQVMYLSDLIKKFPETSLAYYTKLQEETGHWHDKQVLMDALNKKPAFNDHSSFLRLKAEQQKDSAYILSLAAFPYHQHT
jgi:CHAD domain-containing protein